ncbi:cubilin [Biomphalaria pfeifferi]|uniref:Cubilin n=1 Tax=Biomphalaria pfeifferi TaxID=112525 RepID=A0AAD8AUM8_BIOPF|nr:cubilin [Biomphalaria pfeifferi]
MALLFVLFILHSLSIYVNGCNTTYTATSGNITSPNYPDPYDTNLYCTYELYSPTGEVVELYVDFVDLECCVHIHQCDYIQIYNGSSADKNQRLREFCVNTRVNFSSEKLFIVFISDIQSGNKGFSMHYSRKMNNSLSRVNNQRKENK